MIFYAYIYRDPRNGEAFYVGKGKGSRAQSHLSRQDASHMTRRVQKMLREGVRPSIEIIPALDEQHAFFLEECLIGVIGRADLGRGPLLNLTNGGQGMSGNVPSPEALAKRSASLMGRPKNPMSVERMRQTKRECGMTPRQIEANKQPREGFTMAGRKHSEEAKAKMSTAKKGRPGIPRSPETRAKIAAARRKAV